MRLRSESAFSRVLPTSKPELLNGGFARVEASCDLSQGGKHGDPACLSGMQFCRHGRARLLRTSGRRTPKTTATCY